MRDLKIFTNNIEDKAREQIDLLLKQEPFKECKVRIMPDVHAGKGCVIGFTADLGDKVIPNIVGVDIGCGMLCVELGNIDIDLKRFDEIVNKYIPAGRNIREHKLRDYEDIQELHCLRELKETKKFNRAIGTLGGGNHFIELDVDEEDKIILERFLEQYNKMYAECRMILEEKDNTRKVYNENARLKKQIESYKQKIIDLENKIWEGNL